MVCSFDFNSTSRDFFKEIILTFDFETGVSYIVDIYKYDKRTNLYNSTLIHKFILYDLNNLEIVINDIYNKVFNKVSSYKPNDRKITFRLRS